MSNFLIHKPSFAIFVWLTIFVGIAVNSGEITNPYSSFVSASEKLNDVTHKVIGKLTNSDGLKTSGPEDDRIMSAKAAVVKKNDLQCMAENIYYEAASQSYAGKLAVGHVVLNRTKKPGYPSTVCGVIYDGATNNKTSTCQFSWTCAENLLPINTSSSAWEQSLKVARELLERGKQLVDITDGATSYHANYVKPIWSKQLRLVTTIDDHLFYRQQ